MIIYTYVTYSLSLKAKTKSSHVAVIQVFNNSRTDNDQVDIEFLKLCMWECLSICVVVKILVVIINKQQ